MIAAPPGGLEGRFRERWGLDEDFPPRYNAAPGQFLPVTVRGDDGLRQSVAMRWGLLPPWATDERMAYRTINARAETIAEKPSYRAAVRKRRCLVPICGFYEWVKRSGGKTPYFISFIGEPVVSLAGIWERRPTDDGEALETFSIVTVPSSEEMSPLHERMPAVLNEEEEAIWLDADVPLERALAQLHTLPEGRLQWHEVSREVNDARHEGPHLIDPVAIPGMEGL